MAEMTIRCRFAWWLRIYFFLLVMRARVARKVPGVNENIIRRAMKVECGQVRSK